MSRKNKRKNGPKKVDPNDPKYIEEQKYLNRWKGAKSAPSVFEKIDKDVTYESALKGRTTKDPFGRYTEPNMGTAWGIGKPKYPN